MLAARRRARVRVYVSASFLIGLVSMFVVIVLLRTTDVLLHTLAGYATLLISVPLLGAFGAAKSNKKIILVVSGVSLLISIGFVFYSVAGWSSIINSSLTTSSTFSFMIPFLCSVNWIQFMSVNRRLYSTLSQVVAISTPAQNQIIMTNHVLPLDGPHQAPGYTPGVSAYDNAGVDYVRDLSAYDRETLQQAQPVTTYLTSNEHIVEAQPVVATSYVVPMPAYKIS